MIGQTFTLTGRPKVVFRIVWRGSIKGVDCVRGVTLNGKFQTFSRLAEGPIITRSVAPLGVRNLDQRAHRGAGGCCDSRDDLPLGQCLPRQRAIGARGEFHAFGRQGDQAARPGRGDARRPDGRRAYGLNDFARSY